MAAERRDENDVFRQFLMQISAEELDEMTSRLNQEIEAQIDCTTCGACCQQLMINVDDTHADGAANHLNISRKQFDERYVEKGSHGMMLMNTIPCHFLCEKKCTIYDHRFEECRDFPGLHRPGIQSRLFATMIHYGMCPIVFNVMEQLKLDTGFAQSGN